MQQHDKHLIVFHSSSHFRGAPSNFLLIFSSRCDCTPDLLCVFRCREQECGQRQELFLCKRYPSSLLPLCHSLCDELHDDGRRLVVAESWRSEAYLSLYFSLISPGNVALFHDLSAYVGQRYGGEGKE